MGLPMRCVENSRKHERDIWAFIGLDQSLMPDAKGALSKKKICKNFIWWTIG